MDAFTKNDRLIELMTNKYGNFVLKKAYNLAGDREKKNLHAALQKGFTKIHSSKFKSRWSAFFDECLKNPSDPQKLSKAASNEENKQRGNDDLDDEDSDQMDSNPKFPGRKQNKRATQIGMKTTQEPVKVERSKNRKNSAPINALKFSTNFS